MPEHPDHPVAKGRAGRRSVAVAALLAVCACVGAVVETIALRAGGGTEAAASTRPARHTAAAASDQTAVITWVGDTMLGSASAAPADGGRQLFARVRPWIRPADIALGNLEGVLSAQGVSKCGAKPADTCFAFRAPTASADALGWAGFDVMNLANNHAMDYGSAARTDTTIALARAGVASTGGPGSIAFLLRNGIRFAFVGLAPYPWAQDSRDLVGAANLVKAARQKADVVVAMIHAGAEGSDQTHTPVGTEIAFGENRGDTRALAHTLVDAGAALVLGSGPHVVRGIERYRGRLIAYSLGNFAGWHNFASGPVLDQTGVLRLRVDKDGRVRTGKWLSAQLELPGVPVPQPSHISAQLVRQLSISDFGAGGWPMTRGGRLAGWRQRA